MQQHYDAIIVGAGPAGSTAAIRLAQAGWSVAIIEREVFPRRKVCGECVAASNLPLFEAMGVGEMFSDIAGPELRHVVLLCGRERIRAPLPAASDAPQPWGRALGRALLDTLLLERARALGVSVWQPYTVQSLNGTSGAYCCELRRAHTPAAVRAESHGSVTLSAPLAIAANGSCQVLPAERASTGPGARKGDLLAFKANFAGAQLEAGVLPVLAFSGGYGGMVLAEGGVMTLACCIQLAALQRARRANPSLRAGEAVQAYLQEHCAGVHEALSGAQRSGEWLAVGPVRPGVTEARSEAGSVAPYRIGNAAGEAHPLVGEGISMALQSAWLLTSLLIEHPQVCGRGSAALAVQRAVHARYASQWRRQFMGRIRLAACLAQLAMRPRAARTVLPLLRRAPGLLTQGARWSGKVRTLRAPALHRQTHQEVRP